MKLQSFEQMLLEYGIAELDAGNKRDRNAMLTVNPYSVILEGGYLELDSLNRWIENNLGPECIKWLLYGKTGYDYGFAEYFFNDEFDAAKIARVAPNIYTIYPNSYPPNLIARSNGYTEEIVYDPDDRNAILVEARQMSDTLRS